MWVLLAAVVIAQPVFVDAKKPGVYLTFERADKTHYHLKIHNNTRWELWVRQFGDVSKEVDAGLFYEILEDPAGYPPNPLPQGTACHICSVNPIESGTSLRFRVPKSHLGEGLAIRTCFEYEWERKQGGLPHVNPAEHSVTIYHSNLPAAMRKGERRRPAEGEALFGVPVEPIRIPPPPVLKNP